MGKVLTYCTKESANETLLTSINAIFYIWLLFFFFSGVTLMIVPPMPRHLEDLRQKIIIAFSSVDRHILKRAWKKFDFRLDICCITKSTHIEYLWNKTRNVSSSSKVNFVVILEIYIFFISLPNPVGNCDTPCNFEATSWLPSFMMKT